MKLTFGNMTLEMNIFNICKQPGDNNDLQEVDFIEKLVHDQFETISSEIEFNESENLQMVYFQEESKASKLQDSGGASAPCATATSGVLVHAPPPENPVKQELVIASSLFPFLAVSPAKYPKTQQAVDFSFSFLCFQI